MERRGAIALFAVTSVVNPFFYPAAFACGALRLGLKKYIPIVMGDNVRISTVAIAQGNLTIRITETPQVSQPQPFSNTGQTAVVPRTNIQVDDSANKKLGVLDKGVTLQELVNGINALGIGPRDLITILQAIKAAGALQAEIEVL